MTTDTAAHSDRTTVLVAGATGWLGSQIVQELLARGAHVRALVRGAKLDGGENLRDLRNQDGFSVVVGDVTDEDEDALIELLRGVDVVVSALQGGAEVIVDGQQKLIRAAATAGVARLIPSDFSVDLHQLDYGDHALLDLRKQASEEFARSSVAPTWVLNGGFMDVVLASIFGVVDAEARTFIYWGDGQQPMDLTTIADAARYTAAAALDPSTTGRSVHVAGQVATMAELHAEVERSTGQRFAVHQLGTVADLEAEIQRRKADAEDVMDYVFLQYQWSMVSGRAKLRHIDDGQFPDITATSIAQFLADGLPTFP